MTSSQPNSWSTRMNLPPRWVKQPWGPAGGQVQVGGSGGRPKGGCICAGRQALRSPAGWAGPCWPGGGGDTHRAFVAHVDVCIGDERHLEQYAYGAAAGHRPGFVRPQRTALAAQGSGEGRCSGLLSAGPSEPPGKPSRRP